MARKNATNRKTCAKCNQEKSVNDFYVHRGKSAPRDGLQSYCKKCSSACAVARVKSPEEIERYRIWKSQWLKTPKGKASLRKNARKYKEANPYKWKVRQFVSLALHLGVLVRPSRCSLCGEPEKKYANGRSSIEAHHTDYSKPLDVIWLCMPCHRNADKEFYNAAF